MPDSAGAKRRLGIITAPGWMDPNAPDLERLYPGKLQLQQTILPPPGFDYSFASIAACEPQLVVAARLLAEAGCELIIQDGPGFACLIGRTPVGAREAGEVGVLKLLGVADPKSYVIVPLLVTATEAVAFLVAAVGGIAWLRPGRLFVPRDAR